MLSSALRVGHKPVARQKAREKQLEAKAQKQAPAPVTAPEERSVNLKHAAWGTAAVGAQLVALSEAIGPIATYFWGKALSLNLVAFQSSWSPLYLLPSAGLSLVLLLTGALFFKKQQRAPMLLNALVWIAMLQLFPHWRRPLWPAIVFALATLAIALVLERSGPKEPETPIK